MQLNSNHFLELPLLNFVVMMNQLIVIRRASHRPRGLHTGTVATLISEGSVVHVFVNSSTCSTVSTGFLCSGTERHLLENSRPIMLRQESLGVGKINGPKTTIKQQQ